MNSTSRINLAALVTGLFAASVLTTPARSDVIMDWNAKADTIAAEKQISNVPHGRGLAMLHVAMFEAVNAIDGRYVAYRLKLAADRTTSKEAAAAAAGHAVLLALYPDQKPGLDATLAASLAGVAEGEAKSKGIALGKTAAASIIELRAKDGIDAPESYRPHAKPGVYMPTVLPIELTSGALTPWAMTGGSQFRPAPPPALDSEAWTRDVNEIREIGGRKSSRRTAEQTDIGRFWFLSGPRTYNPIVRQVALARTMDIVDCARLYALAAIAGIDAFIAVFDAKYVYNLWRPVTAIRNGDLASNPNTPRDASWLPLGNTPMHPEYPCAHCIVSAAVAEVLLAVAGNEIGEISLTSPTAPGITRKWTRLEDYRDEVSNARIFAGFHYRFSTEVAKEMGKKIGGLTVTTQLRGADTAAQPRK